MKGLHQSLTSVGTDRDLSLCLKTVQKCFGLSFASFSRSSKNLSRLSCRSCLTYDRRALNFSPRYVVGDVLSFLRTPSFCLSREVGYDP